MKILFSKQLSGGKQKKIDVPVKRQPNYFEKY